MKNRLLLLFIFPTIDLGLVYSYSLKSKSRDRSLEEKSDSWHKSREGIFSQEELSDNEESEEKWPGRWMPSRPGDPTPPPKIIHQTGQFKDPNIETHSSHRVGMGVQTGGCDDGKTNLEVDWNWSPVNYTCYDHKIEPNYLTRPFLYCEHVPSTYSASHKCMTETIEYDDTIPIYGTHRPVWPVYGEYKFVPKQRWIHSLEHGAIVMLYHPCANPLEVKRLKKLVSGCLRRHIITPYTLLDEERPLALLSWGCRLTMSYVNPSVVKQFITKKALRGPEEISRNGNFDEYLKKESEIVTDVDDTTLCPDM